MNLQQYNPSWKTTFKNEANLLKSTLGDFVIDIQHIGSTAIEGIQSKPIIDVAILFKKITDEKDLENKLLAIGYKYYPESSSVERMFFRKGDPTQYHLSITEKDKTPYWDRQIKFRDYLNIHPEKAKKYEELKINLATKYPDMGQEYSDGKHGFVAEIVKLAETTDF